MSESIAQDLRTELSGIIVDNAMAIDALLIALFAGGHILIEGYPGTGKTLLARSLAALVRGEAKRIQFTSDMTPSDLIGTNVFHLQTAQFALRKGPLFANIIIADEINRTPPKTQSALLEAMEERTVSIDGVTHPLPQIFLVCATQNPIDFEGTYPLPEAQLDRFLLRVRTSYPSSTAEIDLATRFAQGLDGRMQVAQNLEPIADLTAITTAQIQVRSIYCSPALIGYMHELIAHTRSADEIALGVSPRGLLALVRASQAKAYLLGRNFTIPDDVKAVATSVLAHRILLRPEAELDGITSDSLIARILETVSVPREPAPVS